MTTWTVWGGTLAPGTTIAGASTRTDGFQFTVTEAGCSITGVWFYVPAGETNLFGSNYTAFLWSTTTGTTGTLLASQAGSGTFTAGAWNFIPFATPIPLTAGTVYEAAIGHGSALQFVHNYFTAGGPGANGVTSGPISLPGVGTALASNQMGTNNTFGAFPNGSSGSWYGVDVSITDSLPYVVQTAPDTGGFSNTESFPAGVTQGNWVVVAASGLNGGGTAPTFAPPTLGGITPAGTTQLQYEATPAGGGAGVAETFWLMPVDATVAGQTVVGIVPTLNHAIITAWEVANLGSSPVVDVSSAQTGTSATSDSGSTAPSTSGAEFVAGNIITFGSPSTPPGSPWTNQATSLGVSGYRIAAASGVSYDYQAASSSSGIWAAGVVAISAGGSPPPPGPAPSLLMACFP